MAGVRVSGYTSAIQPGGGGKTIAVRQGGQQAVGNQTLAGDKIAGATC